MSNSNIPASYELVNNYSVKQIALTIEIEGVDVLSNVKLFTKVLYGDGTKYGTPGIVYGGKRPVPGVRDLLQLDGGSLTLSQKIEPEQGRGSISQLSFSFTDLDGYMTRLISPGIIIDEIIGKEVKVRLGFQELSYPDQFFTIFRGRISSFSSETGRVVLSLADPNIIRRQNCFYQAKTKLKAIARANIPIFAFRDCGDLRVGSNGIIENAIFLPPNKDAERDYGLIPDKTITVSGATNPQNNGTFYIESFEDWVSNDVNNVTYTHPNRIIKLYNPTTPLISERPTSGLISSLETNLVATDTTVPVVSNSDFFKHILGPDGLYDSTVKLYIKIDNEWMLYGPAGHQSNYFTVTRAQRGTAAASHEVDSEITQGVELESHGIDLALKLMLSGVGGNYLSSVPIKHFIFTDGSPIGPQYNAIVLPDGKDAVDSYGLTIGDYVTITGSTIPVNNKTVTIERFGDLFGQPNRLIYVNSSLTLEKFSPATLAFRSKYDTLPLGCGVGMTPKEVDVSGHEEIKLVWLNSSENSYRFFINDEISIKTFLESEVYLPMSAYSLTRFGRCSIGVTRPPIADQRLRFLTEDNILNPVQIRPTRSLNNRKFFNRIDFKWDADDDQFFKSELKTLDSDSLNIIGVMSNLPIKSLGGRSDLGFDSVVNRRTYFLLSRYKRAAVMMQVQVNYGVGSLLEAGDIVALKDNGTLSIPNFDTGDRSSGTKLYEIIGRTLNLKDGTAQLDLLGGVSGSTEDRFATWAPSSLIDYSSTASQIRIKDSYGATPGTEPAKWSDYVGQKILIRTEDWSYQEETTLVGLDGSNPYLLQVSPPLSIIPPEGYIVDVPAYPDTTNALDAQIYKVVHGFWNPQVEVVSGLSSTQFTVSALDAAKFVKGLPVYIHDDDYTVTSFDVEAVVSDITGTTITVNKDLGFVPSVNQKIELIGFPDGGQPYRYV